MPVKFLSEEERAGLKEMEHQEDERAGECDLKPSSIYVRIKPMDLKEIDQPHSLASSWNIPGRSALSIRLRWDATLARAPRLWGSLRNLENSLREKSQTWRLALRQQMAKTPRCRMAPLSGRAEMLSSGARPSPRSWNCLWPVKPETSPSLRSSE